MTPSRIQHRAGLNPSSTKARNLASRFVHPANTIGGDVHTSGDFVAGNKVIGGDEVSGDKIAGDKVAGDKIIINFIAPPQPTETISPLLASEIDRQPFEPETVLVASGKFVMGSDEIAEDGPQRTVELATFRMGKTPVTNGQYAEFLKENPSQPEPDRQNWFLRKPKTENLNEHPVVNVSWHDALAYCAWLSKRCNRNYQLPSEAEWEKSARGDDGRRYPWGNQWQEGCANVSAVGTSPVTAFAAGASPYGCLDMLGNVQEWTATPWDKADLPGTYAVRSGSFRSQPGELQCTYRDGIHPDSKVNWRGFRVVLKVAGQPVGQ